MFNKPLIGITPGFDNEKDRSYLRDGYYQAVHEVGGLPVILPLLDDEKLLEEYLVRCDGILLSGGPDLDARHFGEPNFSYNGEISPLRDKLELNAAKRAVELGKPILGICRGIQVLNVSAGGTLYQDIHAQIQDRAILKHSQAAPVWYPTHDIAIKEDSITRKSFGQEKVAVNSFHHQAVKDIAPGFMATSFSPDGLVESIELYGCRFAVGVQWHPELMWQKDRIYLGIFELFVEACK